MAVGTWKAFPISSLTFHLHVAHRSPPGGTCCTYDPRRSWRRVPTTLHHVAAEITKRFGGAAEEDWNSTELISVLHRNGINVGFLGLVLAHVRGAASSFVFSEMLARTARDYLRNSMSRRVEVDEATKVISEFLSEISRAETFTAVWQDELFQRMATKFAAYGSFFSEHATSPPFRWLNRSYVLRRLPSLVGFQFAAGVNTEGTSPFHFPIKALLISQRCFPLPSATAPGIVGHIAALVTCNEGGVAAPAWCPQYTARAQTLQRVATEIIAAVLSDRGANASTIDASTQHGLKPFNVWQRRSLLLSCCQTAGQMPRRLMLSLTEFSRLQTTASKVYCCTCRRRYPPGQWSPERHPSTALRCLSLQACCAALLALLGAVLAAAHQHANAAKSLRSPHCSTQKQRLRFYTASRLVGNILAVATRRLKLQMRGTWRGMSRHRLSPAILDMLHRQQPPHP
ncbi:Hypothetical protein, putative [Bodo saltans]|uniref:CLU central domain-containing protein n=1 Tax=Bodo saltans TaxID=75058 RepID=A0A0S4J3A5_BODSA|nr:Hypothetical protein, putative [Bodo saltans]|eukprot:CUG74897.1 Hypothetical protein, putative [Bodo saltans]